MERTAEHVVERIDVENTFNFRDVGGWRTPDGTVATGSVFRSDGLGRLTARSHERLRELGITTVIDLREEREQQRTPDALDGLDVTYVHQPLFGNRLYPLDRSRTDTITLGGTGSLPRLYSLAVAEFGANIVSTLTRVAESTGPVVFHCSAGKDRTGLIAAFIHELIGVERYDVVTDYNSTERFLGQDFLDAITQNFANAGIVANLSATATQAPREYLDELLAGVDAQYGSAEAYLLSQGLDPQVVQTLRARLITATADN